MNTRRGVQPVALLPYGGLTPAHNGLYGTASQTGKDQMGAGR
jgi:hypothetical protein